MKKFGHPIYHLGISVLFTGACLLSCNEAEKTETIKTTEASHSKHASAWTPTDPILQKGKTIYEAECAMCHDEGEEGAPRLGKASQWDTRKEKPTDELIARAIKGYVGEDGEMPAKGGSDYLSDEEVSAAVKFMVATPTH